ncbi:MAG: hypothetical protein J6T24_04915 [Clostridia bacterium]|nr:hypothetical protein [Clostridia bacterium]
MKKLFSAVAKKHTLEIKRDGKLFLSLPMVFEINGTQYAPALAKKGKNLFSYTDGVAAIAVNLYEKFFTVRASLSVKDAPLAIGMTKLFAGGTIAPVGFDRAHTPQPRNNMGVNNTFTTHLPDISSNGYHTPPCLNFSLGSPDGWVSYGLLDIPDTTECRMEEDGSFLIENCGMHKLIEEGKSYEIPGVIVAFPADEFDSITEFRRNLQALGLYTPCRPSWDELPTWWRYPQFCTYGDQLIEQRVGQLIDDAWVRDFVRRGEEDFGAEHMVICIDDSWQLPHCEVVDTARFPDLRGLIDDMHARGHRVMLWYTPMFEKTTNGVESHAAAAGVLSRDEMTSAYFKNFPGCYAIDYTSDHAEDFLREVAEHLFGDGEGQLNADAVKLDFLGNLRNPAKASDYAHPEYGIGFREYYRYFDLFRKCAKAVKPDVMINATLNDPRFEHLIDVSRLHDTHSGEEEKERRARVMALACPDLPIDTDGALMLPDWLKRNHIAAAVCGMHAIYYTYDCGKKIYEMSAKDKRDLGTLASLTMVRPEGTPVVDDNGHWQLIDADGKVVADCIRGETVIYYPTKKSNKGYIFSFLSELVKIPLHGHRIASITPAPAGGFDGKSYMELDYARDRAFIYLKSGVIYTFEEGDAGNSVDRKFIEQNAHVSEETVNYVN